MKFRSLTDREKYLIGLLSILIFAIAFAYLQHLKAQVVSQNLVAMHMSVIEEKGWNLSKLKDIDCSLKVVRAEDRQYLDMYLKLAIEDVKSYLSADYVTEEIKQHLQDRLDYVPCACRTPPAS